MSSIPEKRIINQCIDKILGIYLKYSCSNIEHKPFDDRSREFSVTYEGYAPRLNCVEVVVQDKGKNRTFLFQVYQDYAECYADEWLPRKIDHYLYKAEITDYPERGHVLYECDGLACGTPCECKDCRHTTDITHAKNFEYKNGSWVEIDEGFDEPNSCESSSDPVNHPNHYEMVGAFESFDAIVESLEIDGARYFCQGNIIKYQMRYKQKNGEEDLKKRHWYSRMDQMLAKCKTIEDYYKLKESDF